jgi:hypothetical protein
LTFEFETLGSLPALDESGNQLGRLGRQWNSKTTREKR